MSRTRLHTCKNIYFIKSNFHVAFWKRLFHVFCSVLQMGRLKMQDLENAGSGKWRTKLHGLNIQDQIILPLVISAKWTKWVVEIMCSFDVCLSVFLSVCPRSGPVNQTSLKSKDFKFDKHVSRDSPDRIVNNFSKMGRGHDHVTP